MGGPTELLRSAHLRAGQLRARYRAAGFWTAEPLDMIRSAAVRHPPVSPLRVVASK